MTRRLLVLLFAIEASCGGATPAPAGPDTGAAGAAGRQMALVPAGSRFVGQADVSRFFRRSAGRDIERLAIRLVAAEVPEADIGCLFDIAETVGTATMFVVDGPGHHGGGALLLETGQDPWDIVRCIERATAGELSPMTPPPEWSDAIVMGEAGSADIVVFARADGTVVLADDVTGRMLLGAGPERPITGDPFYRDLVSEVGPGDATFAGLFSGNFRPGQSGSPPRSGVAGMIRAAGDPSTARVVFVSRHPEDLGEVVDEFLEMRREVGEDIGEIRGAFAHAPLPPELDGERLTHTIDVLSGLLESVSVRVQNDVATFDLEFPGDVDIPALLTDIARLGVAIFGLERGGRW